VRRAFALLLVPLALLAAACGGSSTSATGSGTASGAEVAPADAIGFVSIDTDDGSDQWQQADELLQKFPIREELLSWLQRQIADDQIDFEDDVAPALGPTLDVVAVRGAGGETLIVGLTQPDDADKLGALLKKSDEPIVQTEIDGWTAFSDEQAALDEVRAAEDKLEDDDAFVDAFAELPDEANAKVYLAGDKLIDAVRTQVPQLGLAASDSFDWVSLALSSHDNGWKIDGAAKGATNGTAELDRTLLERIPSGALVALAFDASNTSALEQLRKNPSLSQHSAQLEQLLGVGLDDIVGLLGGSSVLYVGPGAPIPEVTLVTKPKDPDSTLRTIDDAATRIAGLTGGTAPTRTTIDAIAVRKVDLGQFSIYYGIREGELIATNSTSAFGDSSGPSLEEDPVFSDAADAVELPDDAAALIYVNIRDSIPVLEGFALLSGEPFPAEVSANLEPLTSFLGFSTTEGEIANFSSLLQVS
jgi:hypothetical protein